MPIDLYAFNAYNITNLTKEQTFMKKLDFVKLLEANGWYLKRHGKEHDVYTKASGGRIVVPRHSELKEPLVRAEIRKWGLK